jgi:putative tricarboxylic transport membrane protein
MVRDLACGLIALVLAVLYLHETSQIQVSALGDTVGSAGFPLILGWMLAGAGAVLIVQTLVRARLAGAGAAAAPDAEVTEARPGHAFRRAAGLVAIAAAFVALLPILGYVLAVALMLAAVMLYQGLPFARHTLLVAVAGAAFLYGLFGLLLGIPVPRGIWLPLLG